MGTNSYVMNTPIVKCSNWDKEGYAFMSYVYLHGDAEDINGFDCLEGNIEAFRTIMQVCVSCVGLLMPDGSSKDALLIPSFGRRRVEGLVCLLSDRESIKYALKYYTYVNTDMYQHDFAFLRENYPDVYEVIKESDKQILHGVRMVCSNGLQSGKYYTPQPH